MNELPKTRRANQSGGVCVVVAIDAGDEHLRECLESLRANAGAGVEIVEAQHSAVAVNRAIEQASPADIVVLDEPCLVSAGWIERLADAARADTNTASASALADAGTPLALQAPGEPRGDFAQLAEGVAERTLTLRPRLSRAVAPCVYIRRDALQLVGELDEQLDLRAAVEIDLAQRCALSGLTHVAADDVVVARLAPAGHAEEAGSLQTLNARYPYLAESPLADSDVLEHALQSVRPPAARLSVTLDARALDGAITGTHVHVLELILALARTGALHLRVLVRMERIDRETRELLQSLPETELLAAEQLDDTETARSTVFHRPQQTFSPSDVQLALGLGERFVISQLDLIAYRNPGYFSEAATWEDFRAASRHGLSAAERVVVFSEHTRDELLADALVDSSRIRVVAPGLDHRTPGEALRPEALDADGAGTPEDGFLRPARPLARPGVGLLRHPLARPRRLLRARRLRHGHVPDAPDRHPRRLRPPDPARLHGVPELEGAALVYWYGFNWFPYAALMVLLVPGALAFVFGWFAFRSRVTGVYLSIITQALTYALMLGFFRNNFGFGGNNGLTDFKDILGFNVQSPPTRAALFALSAIALALGYLIAQAVVRSKAGKVLIAVRDAESRTRFLGYRVENYKTVRVHAVGLHGRRRRRALRAAGRHHQPERVRARQLDRGGDLGGGRRPRHAGRRGARRRARQLRQDHLHHRPARALLAVRAGRAVRARHHLPAQGHPRACCRSGHAPQRRRCGAPAAGARRASRRSEAPWTPRIAKPPRRSPRACSISTASRVSFDGFRALNNLSLELAPGEMRAIIGPNGAGKTTMMDVITGKTRPDSGDVLFDSGSIDLTTKDEAAIAQLGIGRKFQKPTVFDNHTVEDNVLLALKADRSVRAQSVLARPTATPSASARSSTPSASPPHRHRLAGSLSHGQKQWLEIGMLIAQDPKLLLVDEPVAGMTDAESMTTAELLQGHRQGPHGDRGRARHGVRAPARRQGHGAARRLGAGRRHRSTRSAPTSAWWRFIWGGERIVIRGDSRMRIAGTPGPRVRLKRRIWALGPWRLPCCSLACALARDDRGTGGDVLTVESIDLHYGAAQALRHVSVTPSAGKITCVLGRNGVGKSSLLRAIVGHQPVSARQHPLRRPGHHPHAGPRAGAARHRLRAAGPRDLPAADRAGEPRDRLCPPAAAADARSRTSCSSCFPCSSPCSAGAAAISPAASSSSSPSPAPSSCSPAARARRADRGHPALHHQGHRPRHHLSARPGQDGDPAGRAVFRFRPRAGRQLRRDGARRGGPGRRGATMVESDVRRYLTV